MAGPGYVSIAAMDATGVERNIVFWSDDGTVTGNLTMIQQPQQFVPIPPNALPASIPANFIYNTGVIGAAGFRYVAAGATLAAAGVMTISRYLDYAGQVSAGPDVIQQMTSGQPATINLNDGLPFASFSVSIQNTTGAAAVLSSTAILLGT